MSTWVLIPPPILRTKKEMASKLYKFIVNEEIWLAACPHPWIVEDNYNLDYLDPTAICTMFDKFGVVCKYKFNSKVTGCTI